MTNGRSATPLIALDAVVLDTETTGLDPNQARLIEIAAVRLSRGRIEPEAIYDQRINPGETIPPAATAIHGIDDALVASAPSFAQIWPALTAYIGDAMIIGHTIGFDLALLKRECERAGLDWKRPRTLDTRLLAEVVEPNLAGYGLDQIAAWLGLHSEGRHAALADATLTARVLLALVPRLREGNIRTLAQAEQACRTLTEVLDAQHRAGWIEPVGKRGDFEADRAFERVDSYPYRHRIRDVMSAPPKFIGAEETLANALKQMTQARISALFILPPGLPGSPQPHIAEVGILTERDVLQAIATHGPSALTMSVKEAASRPLVAAPADAFVYRAIGRMSRLEIRHLGIVDAEGRLIGALTMRDLLRLRGEDAIALGDEIEDAKDVAGLARAWAKLPRAAAALRAEGVSGRDVAAIISHEVIMLTGRAAALAEQELGAPPSAFALAVLGSVGRGESLLALDQDNALIFAKCASGGEADGWFAAFGTKVADILDQVGVPYCKGGVMARNPQWRGSVGTWRDRIGDWIRRSAPEDLISVDIFFDLRAAYGDARLADRLWREAFDMAEGEIAFAKLLREAAGSVTPGLGLFGRFKTEGGRIDLKKTGLFGIVTAARVLAIRHHIVERSTLSRLESIEALDLGGDADLNALIEAQGTFLDLILDQQITDIDNGLPAGNAVAVGGLSRHDRDRLRAALEAVRHLDHLTPSLLFTE